MSRTNMIALLIFGAILGYFLTFGPATTQKFKAGVYQLLAPFLTGGSGLKKQLTSVRTGLKSLDQLERENASLQVENRELRATNQGLRDVENEVNRLRHALNYRERSVFKLIAAEIVARDSSTWWRTLTINRGKRDGIEIDMPVATDEGLIGKITTVGDSVSVVLLISDENCRVAAKVEGSREQGIVSGERVTTGLTPFLNLNFLSKQADLKPGQKVYTSGVGGVFPSGLLIGVVKSFRVRELDGQAQLTPANDFLFCFAPTCTNGADCGVFYSSAAVALQCACIHCTCDCLLWRDGPAVSSHAGACPVRRSFTGCRYRAGDRGQS
jgi:rod shape-determining protein MreC